MKTATANPSTAQTNTSLVSAASGRFLRINQVYVSSDTAMTVSLVNSATHDVIWRQYVGANGGQIAYSPYGLATTKVGEGIDYTTSAAGNVFLSVGYGY